MDSTIWWKDICGERDIYDAFWSSTLTLNTTNPDLTNCFQQTAVLWGASALLLFMSVVYVPLVEAAPENKVYISSTRSRQLRQICLVLLIFLSLIELIYTMIKQFESKINKQALPVEYIAACVHIIDYFLLIMVEIWTTKQGIHSPSIVFIFWLVSLLTGVVTFRSKIMQLINGYRVDMLPFVTFYTNFAVSLVAFVTCLFPGKPLITEQSQHNRHYQINGNAPLLERQDEEVESELSKQNPKLKASFLSVLTFSFMFRKVLQIYRKALEWEDLWNIRHEDSCDNIVPRFEKVWEREVQKKQKLKQQSIRNKSNRETFVNHGYSNEEDELVNDEEDNDAQLSSEPQSGTWALAVSIYKAFPVCAFSCGVLLVCDYCCALISPFVLQLLINYVNDGTDYEWKGYLYVVLMFFAIILSALCMQHALYLELSLGMKIRSSLTSLIYKKGLKISPIAKKGYTTGEIVNLMSVDVQKLEDAAVNFNFLWSAPIVMVVVMYFIWQYLGPSSLAGLVVILVILPINTFGIGAMMSSSQNKQMELKDERIKLINQVLGGIKVLKLYAWELYFEDKVNDIRKEELRVLKKMYIYEALIYVMYFASPFLVALASFAAFVLSDPTHVLDSETAFVSMALFNLLNFPLIALPWSLMSIIEAQVSLKRISTFLLADEIDPDNVKQEVNESVITITDGNFSWGEKERSPLRNINMNISRGKLVAIVGQVGSGKSSLLSALLGEMIKLRGDVHVTGSISYFSQQSWIQNMTLKDNVVFSKPYLESKYNDIISACSLEPDLQMLPSGDLTEIGERGVNLSGGQKARVSLARAVYQDYDIYLLDDPLSAVDAHVGKDIFNNVIGSDGLLKDKTRVLVTNQLTYLPKVDEILVLKNGEISERGSYDDLLSHDGAFAEFIRTYLQETEGNTELDEEAQQQIKKLQKQVSIISSNSEHSDRDSIMSFHSGSPTSIWKRSQKVTHHEKTEDEDKEFKNQQKKNVLMSEETADVGNIKPAVLRDYMKAAGFINAALTLLSVGIFVIAQTSTNIWLSIWSTDVPVNGTMDSAQVNMRLGVYGALGFCEAVGICGIALGIAMGAVSASKKLHSSLLKNILKTPMAFFDATPLGRIVNRFSKDIDIVDTNLPESIQSLMTTLAPLCSTIIIIIYSLPIFAAIFVPVFIIFFLIQRFYVTSARQLKRFDSIKRSPIYAFFNESLNGASTIRAYKQQDRFIQELEQKLDDSQKVWYEFIITNRWMGISAQILANLIVLLVTVIIVIQRDTIGPEIVGLVISFSLQVSESLIWGLRNTSDLETYIVAVERIQEYSNLESEALRHIEAFTPPPTWPEKGAVEFKNLSTRYRAGLELVLKGISFIVNPGEKIGVVGRTGAGKSSMTLSLFRIIEAAGGSVEIDGRDISKMGLYDLRSKLTIIPQDPLLFSGSLKFNIDPSGTYPEIELDTAIEHAHLQNFVQGLPNGLEYECGEDGENLSVGQRQLVCLARALLRKTKILVLDEATASVDLETDELIQSTIRNEFQDSTVITIAHRLNTIMDYDRLIIMSAGEIKEFDTPNKLLEDSNSLFYGMAKDAGLA